MRVLLFLLTATSLATTAPLAQERDRARRERAPAPANLQHFTFEEGSLQSAAVGREVPFGIYLPKGYRDAANAATSYPLVIWLHGMWEDHVRFHERGGAPVLDRAVAEGKLPPCIFVTANGGRTSMYVNRKQERWEDLVTVDLLAHLKDHYRICDRRERRAILGVSMGGMAALRIAFSKPALFGAVGAHSAAVFAEDPELLPERIRGFANRLGLDEVFGNPIQKEPWQQANPLCIARRVDPAALAGLRIYFDAGTADRYGFAEGNELLHKLLDERKVPHTWRLIDGGGHSWGAGFQEQTLPHSFALVGAMFAASDRGDGKGAPATGGEAAPARRPAGGG